MPNMHAHNYGYKSAPAHAQVAIQPTRDELLSRSYSW